MQWKTKITIKGGGGMMDVEFVSTTQTMNRKLAYKLVAERLHINEKDIIVMKNIEKV